MKKSGPSQSEPGVKRMFYFSHQASSFLGCVHIVSCEAFQDTVSFRKLLEATQPPRTGPVGPRRKDPGAWRTENPWLVLSSQWETHTVEARPLHSFLSTSPPQQLLFLASWGPFQNLPYLACCLPRTPFLLGKRKKGRQGRLREGRKLQPPADIISWIRNNWVHDPMFPPSCNLPHHKRPCWEEFTLMSKVNQDLHLLRLLSCSSSCHNFAPILDFYSNKRCPFCWKVWLYEIPQMSDWKVIS